MDQILSNLIGKFRRETLLGKQYLVVDANLIVPGVLAGSAGPGLYPPDETSKDPSSWNHMPIVLYHPINAEGKPISARNPDVLNKSGIGFVFHTKYDDKLAAQAWFDEEVTRKVSPHVHEALLNGTPLEISTGLFTKPDHTKGVYNGKEYHFIARDHRPDHLAVLPDKVGACSLKDGCGINNSYYDEEEEKKNPTSNIIGRLPDGQYRLYSRTGGNLGTFDSYEAASKHEREVEYFKHRDKHNNSSHTGDNTMALTAEQKSGIISYLTTNCDCWKGKDDPTILNSLSDEKLVALKQGADNAKNNALVANALKDGFEDDKNTYKLDPQTNKFVATPKKNPADDGLLDNVDFSQLQPGDTVERVINSYGQPKFKVAKKQGGQVPNNQQHSKSQTEKEWFDSAPPRVQQVFTNALEAQAREKADMVARLTANIKDDAPKAAAVAVYNTMTNEQLRPLVALIPAQSQQDYSGANSHLLNFFGAQGIPQIVDVNGGANDRKDDFADIPAQNDADNASPYLLKYLNKKVSA